MNTMNNVETQEEKNSEVDMLHYIKKIKRVLIEEPPVKEQQLQAVTNDPYIEGI